MSFVAGCRATLLQHNYAAHIEQPAYEPTQIAVVHQLHLRLWQLRMRRSRIRIDVEPKLLLARCIQYKEIAHRLLVFPDRQQSHWPAGAILYLMR